MQLSKLENKAYKILNENNIFMFKVRDLSLLLKVNNIQAYNIIKALKGKGVIKKISNFFVLNDADEMAVASAVNFPSYISFWSALSYYGFSDQTPKKIFLATTSYSKEIDGFKCVTISKRRFFGYKSFGDIVIAEKEKAIIDSLLLPKYSGGIKEVMNAFKRSFDEFDIKKLISYAIQVESKSVIRRLGYIMDEVVKYKGREMEKILGKIGKGYELLDPNLKRKNNLNKKWLLDINTK